MTITDGQFLEKFSTAVYQNPTLAREFLSFAKGVLACPDKKNKKYARAYFPLMAAALELTPRKDIQRLFTGREISPRNDRPYTESAAVSEIFNRCKIDRNGVRATDTWFPILLVTASRIAPSQTRKWWQEKLDEYPSANLPDFVHPQPAIYEISNREMVLKIKQEIEASYRKQQKLELSADPEGKLAKFTQLEKIQYALNNWVNRSKWTARSAIIATGLAVIALVTSVLTAPSLQQTFRNERFLAETNIRAEIDARNRLRTTRSQIEDTLLSFEVADASAKQISQAYARLAELRIFVSPESSLNTAQNAYVENLNDPEAWLRYAILSKLWGVNDIKTAPNFLNVEFSASEKKRIADDIWVFDFWAEYCLDFEALDPVDTISRLQSIRDENLRTLSILYALGQFDNAGKSEEVAAFFENADFCESRVPRNVKSYCFLIWGQHQRLIGQPGAYMGFSGRALGEARSSGEKILEPLALLMIADAGFAWNDYSNNSAKETLQQARDAIQKIPDKRFQFVAHLHLAMLYKNRLNDSYSALLEFRTAFSGFVAEYYSMISNPRNLLFEYSELERRVGQPENAIAILEAMKPSAEDFSLEAHRLRGWIEAGQSILLTNLGETEAATYLLLKSVAELEHSLPVMRDSVALPVKESIEAALNFDISACGSDVMPWPGLLGLIKLLENWESKLIAAGAKSTLRGKIAVQKLRLFQASLYASYLAPAEYAFLNRDEALTYINLVDAETIALLNTPSGQIANDERDILLGLLNQYNTTRALASIVFSELVAKKNPENLLSELESQYGILELAENNWFDDFLLPRSDLNSGYRLSVSASREKLKSWAISLNDLKFDLLESEDPAFLKKLLHFWVIYTATEEGQSLSSFLNQFLYSSRLRDLTDSPEANEFVVVQYDAMRNLIDFSDGTRELHLGTYYSRTHLNQLLLMAAWYRGANSEATLRYISKVERLLIDVVGSCEPCERWRANLNNANFMIDDEVLLQFDTLDASDRDTIFSTRRS